MIQPKLPLSIQLVPPGPAVMVRDSLSSVLGVFYDPQHADFIVDLVNACHREGFKSPSDLRSFVEEHQEYEREIGRLEDKLDKAKHQLTREAEINESLRNR